LHYVSNLYVTSFLLLGTSSTSSNTNQEERNDTQPASVQRNPGENPVNQATSRRPDASFPGEPGVRLVPIRTMVAAAVPGPVVRPPSESSGNSLGLYYPILGRFQHVSSGHVNSEQRSQHSNQHHAAVPSTTDSMLERQTTDDSTRNGNLTIVFQYLQPLIASCYKMIAEYVIQNYFSIVC